MILAGDIGGTNCRLALFEDDLSLLREQTFHNAGRPGLDSAVNEFLSTFDKRPTIARACFGVAGPVQNGRVKLTNLDWRLDESTLVHELQIPHVALINDLRAHAEGVALLKPDQVIVLNSGNPQPAANRAIIAAGTGLGEAGLVWDDQAKFHRAVACEGGHCDFAPRDEREMALLSFLKKHNKPLTWEAVLSGPGLRNIYDFILSETGPAAALAGADPTPAAISAAALANSNRAAAEALDLFIAFYGAEAGNLALKYLAIGGVYLGGGIAPKIAQRIAASTEFFNRFRHKGPPNIQALLESIPISIINSPANALYGSASYAHRMLPAH